jgi:hypothetical protein
MRAWLVIAALAALGCDGASGDGDFNGILDVQRGELEASADGRYLSFESDEVQLELYVSPFLGDLSGLLDVATLSARYDHRSLNLWFPDQVVQTSTYRIEYWFSENAAPDAAMEFQATSPGRVSFTIEGTMELIRRRSTNPDEDCAREYPGDPCNDTIEVNEPYRVEFDLQLPEL